MKLFAAISAVILMIFLVLTSVSAQESKGKSIQPNAHQQKIKKASSSETASHTRNTSGGIRFQSIDAKNVYFQLNPTSATFTIEF